jgi:hypothetical protein
MADVRVYDIALNEDEIRAVMEGEVSTSPEFLRGDADGNGALEVTDPILNLTFQFVGGVEVTCMDALDDDDSGAIDVSDPIYNLTVQFIGGPAIPAPGFEVCGPDPTEDALSCEAFPACS